MLLSAIVSTYDGAAFIKGCLEDLLAQSLFQRGLMEVLVIDSASPGNEAEIIAPFVRAHENVSYLRTPERENMYAAWNRGIFMAKGTYLTNANVDDRHSRDYLELLVNALEADASLSYAYGDSLATMPDSGTGEALLYRNQTFFAPSMLVHHLFGYQPVWRKSLHDAIGLFDSAYAKAGDYEFSLRAAAASRAAYVPEATGLIHWDGNTQTLSDLRMKREVERIKTDWLQEDKIFSLYRMEGISSESHADKAAILHDLADRFLVYFPQWKGGNPEIDPARACSLYQRSLEIAWSIRAANNLSVAKFISGNFKGCLDEIQSGRGTIEREILARNQKAMIGFIDGDGSAPRLSLLDSSLALPSESNLAHEQADLVHPSTSTSDEGFSEIDVSSLWAEYLGCFSSAEWADLEAKAESGRLYIYGAGARGLIFSELSRRRLLNITAFLDADQTLSGTRLNGLPIHPPDYLASANDSSSSIVLMAGRAHWPNIIESLKPQLPRKAIFTPSFSFPETPLTSGGTGS